MHPHLIWQQLKRCATLLVGTGLSLASSQAAIAQEEATLLLLTNVPDPFTLTERTDLPAETIITADTISQTGLTVPSLWWTDAQFGDKLLDTWFAFPNTEGIPPRVDMVVNQQVWSLYTYLERFAFVNQFGTTARDFGYNARVFNRQRDLLAAYICDFPPVEDTTDSNAAALSAPFELTSQESPLPNCYVFLDASGQGGLRGVATPLGANSAITGGTAQP